MTQSIYLTLVKVVWFLQPVFYQSSKLLFCIRASQDFDSKTWQKITKSMEFEGSLFLQHRDFFLALAELQLSNRQIICGKWRKNITYFCASFIGSVAIRWFQNFIHQICPFFFYCSFFTRWPLESTVLAGKGQGGMLGVFCNRDGELHRDEPELFYVSPMHIKYFSG